MIALLPTSEGMIATVTKPSYRPVTTTTAHTEHSQLLRQLLNRRALLENGNDEPLPNEEECLVDTARTHEPAHTVTDWCQTWSERTFAMSNGCSTPLVPQPGVSHNRARIPFMVASAPVMTENQVGERVRTIRSIMISHRHARRQLVRKLKTAVAERHSWLSVCSGDECELGETRLQEQERELRQELEKHRLALEMLEDEQRECLRSQERDIGEFLA